MNKKVVFIVGVMLTLLLVGCDETPNYQQDCMNECNKFSYEFYRVELIDTYAKINYYCWCLKNNEPIPLGSLWN